MRVVENQLSLFDRPLPERPRLAERVRCPADLLTEIAAFDAFGASTRSEELRLPSQRSIPVLINEYWTAGQRQANRLHEVSYRACFKPQLPRFFIERLTRPGQVVYDPFAGRGTTPIEAALLGRIPWAVDVNPVSRFLITPRLAPVTLSSLEERLRQIDFARPVDCPEDLLVFYHPATLQEICALRAWLLERRDTAAWDDADGWIQMVATNRLTGHSAGFFSVYTLPPNQATSVTAQKRINLKRNQTPPRRQVPHLILRKARQLLSELSDPLRARLAEVRPLARIETGSADHTPGFPADSIDLVVTSPPFLNAVDYRLDNWLRGWFCGIDLEAVTIWQLSSVDRWEQAMQRVFVELRRLLKPGALVAFEVGEVVKGDIRLEEHVCGAAECAGLEPLAVMINAQDFTKTSNCWGITNGERGTNTNRICLLRKTA